MLEFQADTDENGTITLSQTNLDKNVYDFVIHIPKYLTKVVQNVDLTTITSSSLQASDIAIGNLDEADDEINELDREFLIDRWGTEDMAADLNHDNVINNLDWSMMNANWNKIGDEATL